MADSSEPKPESKSDDITVIDPYALAKVGVKEDLELNDKINKAIKDILAWDDRISSEPETVMALKDYIQAEIVGMMVFKRILEGADDSNTERLFRACLNAKNILRDEVWGKVKGTKPKEDEVGKVREILIEHKIIDVPVKGTKDGTGPTDKREPTETGNKQ